jgi:two-component system KDP operon response regulator KdpE
MLTAKGEERDKVQGLRLGADDYVTKPFGAQELLARVEAVLRRSQFAESAGSQPVFSCGGLTIDFAQRRVTLRGQEVKLSPTEYRLLHCLAANAGRVVVQEEILAKVWGPEYGAQYEGLRVYIHRLRQKIEADPNEPKYILTHAGVGYMLAAGG